MSNHYVLGIDLGGTAAKLGLIPLPTLLESPSHASASSSSASPPFPPPPFLHRAPLPLARADRTPTAIVTLLVDACRELLAEGGIGWKAVAAVGVGFPGHVKEGGTVAAGAANLSEEWKAGVPLVKLLEEGFRKLVEDGGQMRPLDNIPNTIVLVNDADAALAAEAWGGAAQGHKDVVMLTLGTGIGVATWLNGQAWSGSRGLVEGGHMVVEKEGRKCGCGQKGCLEMYASATAVVRRAKELGFSRRCGAARKEGGAAGGEVEDEERKKASPRKEEEGRDEEEEEEQGRREQEGDEEDDDSVLNAKHVFEAAFSSPPDPVALQVVDEAADYLGLGCLNLVRVLDPSVVLFAGGMSGAGARFVGMVKERFAAYGWTILPHDVEMGIAALGGEQAGVWGSARAAVMRRGGK